MYRSVIFILQAVSVNMLMQLNLFNTGTGKSVRITEVELI